jgi:hypothetical protein
VASVNDCAVLSNDVYNRENNELANSARWQRLDAQNWSYGFAAGTYQRGDERVIAFRGTDTDDSEDIFGSNALMVPLMQAGAARTALESLFREYGVDDGNALSVVAPRVLEGIVQLSLVRSYIRLFLNRVPGQLNQALEYFDGCEPRPRFVTGHSLGGALAQLVAQQRSVPAIAFNSPFMGTLEGGVPATSMLVAQVNSRGDPLSLATQNVGNLPHGRVIWIALPSPPVRPPVFQRRQLRWTQLATGGLGAVAMREAEAHTRYYRELLSYLGEAMLYYHSMEQLRLALAGMRRYGQPLTNDLGNL